MKKNVLLFLLTCISLALAHSKDSVEWYLASDLERNSAGVSWTIAQNSCKKGWHLPDKFELSWFVNQKYDLKGRDGKTRLPYCFWSSYYEVKPAPLIYYACENGMLRAGTYSEKRKANVICFKDRYQNINDPGNGNYFYGPTDGISKFPGCVKNKVFVDYYKMLSRCSDDRSEEKKKIQLALDSITINIDSVVYSLQNIPPCTEYLQDKVYMLRDYSLFKCVDYNWYSLGFLKKNKIHLDSITYLNEIYKLVDIETKKHDSGRMTWFIDNLRSEVPGSSCYENKKEYCVKYGVLYKSYEKKLCPQGWDLPHKSDWIALFEIYGLNGSELKFFDPQPAGLYGKKKDLDDVDKYFFSGLGKKTGWWSFDDDNRLFAIVFDGKNISHTYDTKGNKYYIRCVKHNW